MAVSVQTTNSTVKIPATTFPGVDLCVEFCMVMLGLSLDGSLSNQRRGRPACLPRCGTAKPGQTRRSAPTLGSDWQLEGEPQRALHDARVAGAVHLSEGRVDLLPEGR